MVAGLVCSVGVKKHGATLTPGGYMLLLLSEAFE